MGGLKAEKGQWRQPSELGTLRRGTVSPGEKQTDSSCTLEGRSMSSRQICGGPQTSGKINSKGFTVCGKNSPGRGLRMEMGRVTWGGSEG